jgi:DNA-binding response OmpR family regulator
VLEQEPVDLILADIAMPEMNGYQLYERVRSNPRLAIVPFVLLTARKLDSDIRYGKELGVDDYLTKPIRSADLLASVRGKLLRAQQMRQLTAVRPSRPAPESACLSVGPLQVNPEQHRAWMSGKEVKLSAKEFALLAYMADREDMPLPPQELIRVTHRLETDPVDAGSLLRPLIRSLRRKLGYAVGEMGCIENVRGVGYRLVFPHD